MLTMLVAAGIVIENARVLLSQRKKGAHLAGLWEFPGGKVEPGEDPRAALVREFDEELGIAISVGPIVNVTFHRYEDRAVLLHFYDATRVSGDLRARDVAAFDWFDASGIDLLTFPAADVDVVEIVRGRLGGARSR